MVKVTRVNARYSIQLESGKWARVWLHRDLPNEVQVETSYTAYTNEEHNEIVAMAKEIATTQGLWDTKES